MNEEDVWKTIEPEDAWILDKLILSMKLGYTCGPIGVEVPHPSYYIIRPCVNAIGLGMGAKKIWIEKSTDDLPLGFFWCEWFEGRHISVDYINGEQKLAVEGFKKENTFTHWDKWIKVNDKFELPSFLETFVNKYKTINCEFIGNKLIEVHFRENSDFKFNNSEFIPVWNNQSILPPVGYSFIEYPDIHGRIGAMIK